MFQKKLLSDSKIDEEAVVMFVTKDVSGEIPCCVPVKNIWKKRHRARL